MLSICFPLFCSYSIFSICNNDNSLNLVFAILSIFSVFCFHPKLFLWHYFFKIFQGIFRDLPLSSFFFIIKMFFFVLFLCFVSLFCFVLLFFLYTDRVYFNQHNQPAFLQIDPVKTNDAGEYRCRVDFKKARTVNIVIQLKVIGKIFIFFFFEFYF